MQADRDMAGGKRVSMLVWNTFENDARVLKEAETLQGCGWQVSVFALHTPGVTQREEVVGNGVRVVRVLRSPGLWFRRGRSLVASHDQTPTSSTQPPRRGAVRKLALIVSRFLTHLALMWRMVLSRPAIVHAHDVNVALTAWFVAVLSRAKFVYDAHEVSTSREGYQSIRKLVAAIERKLMPRADAVITTTRIRARFFVRAYGIPHPLVLQNWPRYQQPGRSNRIQEELNVGTRLPVVLYQGGLQQGRGLEHLVQAAARIQNAEFVFIGGGRLAGRLKALVDELGIGGRVKFIPTVPVSELASYTVSAHIGVQPLENTCFNHYSTDSNKLFEYISAGLPVVASSFPEMRRVIRHYGVGVLVEPGNVDELVSAIQSLVNEPEQRERMRQNALEAAKELCWEKQEHRLVELYHQLAGD